MGFIGIICVIIMTVTLISIEIKTKRLIQEQAETNRKLEQLLRKERLQTRQEEHDDGSY
ncbi:hypothetical protein [Paenibacillus sp. OK076]|uniref:hypothetical protein n=1 Tax=Paenibacillus sp. OK076 TaxID=1884379 RepID=UPI0008D5349C|nr:hypothetical protein [Paenibacillus sp. OK076]SEN00456.1 hypothetical protein SAMN05518670_0823 [Paenibacillus sp. OK076]